MKRAVQKIVMTTLLLAVAVIARGAESGDLEILRSRVTQQRVAAKATEVAKVESAAREFLALELPLEGDEYGQQFVRQLSNTTRVLSFCAAKEPAKRALLVEFIDHLNASQLLNRMTPFRHSSYTELREVPRNFLYALPYLEGEQREELREGIKHIIEFEYTTRSREQIHNSVSSDYIFLVTPHLLFTALAAPTDEQAAQEMRGVTQLISGAAQYADGGADILKPDGTGFHHNTHYNGYMYSFNTWVNSMYKLRGTAYRAEREAYEHLKKAVVSVFLMATCSDKGSHLTANSLAGRHPLGGMAISSDETTFKELLEVGADLYEEGIDTELAAYYNYIFKSDKYKGLEVEIPTEQYYQFNYSPIGVYRKDHWVATMRTPTSKFWGAEIYNKTNRFGRYQSHGTLEIVYEGDREKSGYVDYSRKGSVNPGGWDWNVAPGATTVHYTDWEEMMPGRSRADRFDQYAETTNFSGALAWDKVGLWGSEFDQVDSWSAMRFEPTNLTFKKSVFAVDGILISLGSDISSSGEYSDDMITATNLFQAVEMPLKSEFVINGKAMKYGAAQRTLNTAKSAAWLLTPQTTGYIIPAGNDELVLFHGDQTAPSQDASDLDRQTTRRAAKSYIRHGVKPSERGYEFVVVPATTTKEMDLLYKSVCGAKNTLYEVLSKSGSLHALRHFDTGIVAYTAFEAQRDLEYGYLLSTASEMLLMERYDESQQQLSIALCNPNLRPETTRGKAWIATPTHTSITVKGLWSLSVPNADVEVTRGAETTTITITLSHGAPLYLDLVSE